MMSAAAAYSSVMAPDREVQASLPILEDSIRSALRRLRTRMHGRSGVDTPIRLAQVQVCPVGELLEQPEVADGAAWSGFHLDRAGVAGFSVIEGRLLERLVGRLFGDTGPVAYQSNEQRSVTEVELRVATRLSEELYLALEANWPARPAPRMISHRALPTRHGVADMPPNTLVVSLAFECGTAEDPLGVFYLALPALMLRGLGVVVEASGSQRPQNVRRANYERLMPCEVDLVVELLRVKMRLGNLHGLTVGDEIPLPPIREATAHINGRVAFTGEAGANAGVRSFRVQKRCGGDSSPG